jgi:hypothetical protein
MRLGRRRSFAIVVGFGLIAAACSGGGNDHSSASTIVESSTGQSDVAVTAEKAPTLVTLAGDPFEDATLAEIAASEVGLLPSGFTTAGAGVDVTVEDGSVGEPLRLSVPGKSPPADAVAVLLHRNDAGMWEANPAEHRDGVYVADVSSFSPFLPGFLNPFEWFDSVSDWLTGRTDPPADCETDPYGWVADQASGPADGSFHACVRANPDPDTGVERVEVKIKSNRSMAMWISIPDHERDYLWVEGAPEWDSYGVAITELDGGSPNRVLLGPGRTMTVGYTRPIGAGPELVFSSYQNNTTQIASLAQQYLGDLGSLGLLAAMVVCVEGANTREGFGALALDAAVECLPKTAEMLITSGITDGGKAFGSILDTRYASIVAQGRMQLSAGASDGIEQLVNNASATGSAATAFKAAGNALLAANLLADATSMLSDAVLAFTPGLNTYTVFLVGGADSDTSAVTSYRYVGDQDLVSTDGWIVKVAWELTATPRKDVSSSPPGKAQLVMAVDGQIIVSNETPGGRTPRLASACGGLLVNFEFSLVGNSGGASHREPLESASLKFPVQFDYVYPAASWVTDETKVDAALRSVENSGGPVLVIESNCLVLNGSRVDDIRIKPVADAAKVDEPLDAGQADTPDRTEASAAFSEFGTDRPTSLVRQIWFDEFVDLGVPANQANCAIELVPGGVDTLDMGALLQGDDGAAFPVVQGALQCGIDGTTIAALLSSIREG